MFQYNSVHYKNNYVILNTIQCGREGVAVFLRPRWGLLGCEHGRVSDIGDVAADLSTASEDADSAFMIPRPFKKSLMC